MRSRSLLVILLVFLSVLAISCGGGGSSTVTSRTLNNTPPASVVQVTLGDDPSDRVASLSITVNSILLTSDSGSTVSLISNPITVEVSTLAGTTTPLGTVNVPLGLYTKASITLGGATVTVVDPNTGTTMQKTFAAPANPFVVTFNPVFGSSGSPMVINFDLNLHASVAIDTLGNITFNPLFLVSHGNMSGPATGSGPNPFTGGIEHTLGTVTAVTGSGFTITTAIGQRTLTFTTNSSTVFKGIGGLSTLQTGTLVLVGGQTQSDGSLLALGVAVVDMLHAGPGAVGVVAKTTGTPVTQFVLIAHGLTMSTALSGLNPVPQAGLTVNVATGTHFEADTDNVDMSGLSLTFDASTLSPAQHVAVGAQSPLATSSGTMMGSLPVLGTLTASQVRLIQQPVIGTISNLTSTSFTLTVPSDSVFATVAKTSSITVFKQSGTQLQTGLTLANGQKVVVRGLLFNNSGYQMVATRIGQLQ